MTPSTSPSTPTPAGDDRNLVRVDENYVAPSFEDRLRIFWEKNQKIVTAVLVLILLGILGKGGWEYLQAQKEREIGQSFAAATTPAQIKAFALANPQHPLAGVAQLRIADDAYTAGNLEEAGAAYDQAAAIFKSGPLASRAKLGSAMVKLQSGGTADSEAAMKAFAGDTKEIKSFRAEAYYHLATNAAAKNNLADMKTYSDQLMQLDPSGPWTQRVLALRATLPIGAEAAVNPAIALPASAK